MVQELRRLRHLRARFVPSASTQAFCKARDIDWGAITALPPGERLQRLEAAQEILVSDESDKRAYLQQANPVACIFKAILPDQRAEPHAPLTILMAHLAAMIRSLNPPPD